MGTGGGNGQVDFRTGPVSGPGSPVRLCRSWNQYDFSTQSAALKDAKYAYNNLQEYDFSGYHKFNAKWHYGTETWYMNENNVPNVAGNVANPAKPELGANGAFCAAGQLRCPAPEYAIVNY